MRKKLYNALGMSLLRLPTTKKNRINNKQRNVKDLKAISAAQMISITEIQPNEPTIFCGRYNKALSIIRQLIKKSERPFVLIGTKSDLNENSCFRVLNAEWEEESISCNLSDGNGMLILKPKAGIYLELKEYILEWDSHFLIMCLGNGLQMDQELLNLLNSRGNYVLISENLQRGIKFVDGCKMTVAELLSSMEYIMISSVGMAGKELLKVLPDMEYEKITNTTDLSLHRDAPYENKKGNHHRNGGGLGISQSKVRETHCIFTEEDLKKMQDNNQMVIYNSRTGYTFVAKITN